MESLVATSLELPGRRQGKVRDVYDLPPAHPGGPRRVLMVATDRLSAFDVVLPTPIPGKGRLLTLMALRWFRWIESGNLANTHVLSSATADIPGISEVHRSQLEGRVIIGRACRVVPVECVVRGYLDGSGWKEYQQTGCVCGVRLPDALRRGDCLPEPIFTPATKAELGAHDENISFEHACDIVGRDVMLRLRDTSFAIYNAAHAFAAERGVILADTKFEFGFPLGPDGRTTGEPPILIDEALTPDSSRYWPTDSWKPGGPQVSYDKQFVRDYLQDLVDRGLWDKTPPGPDLPEHVVSGTLAKYREAFDRLFA
ncbi:MAG: phosphoribosylaminoimidazolesuccinocarboxamide synthase [Phycisphaerales bacterium]